MPEATQVDQPEIAGKEQSTGNEPEDDQRHLRTGDRHAVEDEAADRVRQRAQGAVQKVVDDAVSMRVAGFVAGPLEHGLLKQSAKGAANEFFHDLVGPAVNFLHPRVGIHARDFILIHVARAPVQLQAVIDNFALLVRGPVFGH